jgi:hypothetical protein
VTDGGRRSFWDDASGIHIPLGRLADGAGLWTAIERAADGVCFQAEGVKPGRRFERRRFRPSGALRALGVSIDPQHASGAQVTILPAFDMATDTAEADGVTDFALRLCAVLDAPMARSFSTVMPNGYIDPDEIEGPLRWLDWWQYLGAAVVSRIGRAPLKALNVFQVSDGPGEGLVVRVTQSPTEAFRRRPLAEQLGIRLKPWRDWHPDTQTWSEREWPL